MIYRFGSAEHVQKFMPRLLTCEIFVSYCLTEPDRARDAAALRTRRGARRRCTMC